MKPATLNEPYDASVLREARAVSDAAIEDLLSGRGPKRGVVVSAPAGAGKSGLVVDTVGAVRKRKLRVAVGTPTNEQAFGLVRRLATKHRDESVTFLPAMDVSLPPDTAQLPNVFQSKAQQANSAGVIVGTLSKLGDASSRGHLGPVDALLIDESYQADMAVYYAVGALADLHFLVGDSGQLLPFSTVDDPDYWRGLPENPLQTAVGILLRNHPGTRVHKLPITRRLDSRAVAVVKTFYPDLLFRAAVLPGVRQLRILPGIANKTPEKLIDCAWDRVAAAGWAHVELPAAPVLTADAEIVELISGMVDRLGQRGPRVRCELQSDWQDLQPERVAVGVSHNEQKNLLRSRLDANGHPNVVVETANKLQGLEFDVVIAWHPLAGLSDADEFHLDAGRLCVLLTRHRHACILVGRATDRRLLDAIPPPTPAYIGWDTNPLYEGWGIHEAVFAALEPHRLTV